MVLHSVMNKLIDVSECRVSHIELCMFNFILVIFRILRVPSYIYLN